MTTEPERVEEVAKGLTKAQRTLLMEDQPWSYEGYRPGALLEQRGLLVRRKIGLGTVVNHTPLGLAVRAHLLAKEGRNADPA